MLLDENYMLFLTDKWYGENIEDIMDISHGLIYTQMYYIA